MGLLADNQNFGLRMYRECRESFPRHRLQSQSLVSDPGIHHGTCVTHVPWCMSVLLTRAGGENVPGIPGACTNSLWEMTFNNSIANVISRWPYDTRVQVNIRHDLVVPFPTYSLHRLSLLTGKSQGNRDFMVGYFKGLHFIILTRPVIMKQVLSNYMARYCSLNLFQI